jgi:hypothetical protein
MFHKETDHDKRKDTLTMEVVEETDTVTRLRCRARTCVITAIYGKDRISATKRSADPYIYMEDKNEIHE